MNLKHTSGSLAAKTACPNRNQNSLFRHSSTAPVNLQNQSTRAAQELRTLLARHSASTFRSPIPQPVPTRRDCPNVPTSQSRASFHRPFFRSQRRHVATSLPFCHLVFGFCASAATDRSLRAWTLVICLEIACLEIGHFTAFHIFHPRNPFSESAFHHFADNPMK